MPAAGKCAYLVLGPESHGTHLVTNILIHAGCMGHAGGQTAWYTESREIPPEAVKPWEHALPIDTQPWDATPPAGQSPIAWRRSVPHGGSWVDISAMVDGLRRAGYTTVALVVTREIGAAIRSQLKWRHVASAEEARRNIERAYRHIYRHIDDSDVPHVVVSYEALVGYPEAQSSLLREIGLEPPDEPYPVVDGNGKWYGR